MRLWNSFYAGAENCFFISICKKLKPGSHGIHSYREIFLLHLLRKNAFYIINLSLSAHCEYADFLVRIVSRCKKRKSLDVILSLIHISEPTRLLSISYA